MNVLGIDPGKSGGLALLREGSESPWTQKMPETDRDVYDAIEAWCYLGPTTAFIEQVNAMPKDARSAAFKFGRSYGLVFGCLIACQVPIERVLPRVWQQKLGCLSGGDKRVTRARAQELFPQVPKITHAIADALLIAEYGRRMLVKQGKLARPVGGPLVLEP
jgi:crossover junction endodeoxyribonuclease RuvC